MVEEKKLANLDKLEVVDRKDLTETPTFINEISNRLYEDLICKLDEVFIEGLKRKGFEFKSRIEVECFIKEHCRCDDSVSLKERVYYVDGKPFLLHSYKVDLNLNSSIADRTIKVYANSGSFSFL